MDKQLVRPTYIYVILKDDGSPTYVGKTVHLKKRKNEHRRRKGRSCAILVIEVVPYGCDWESREKFWIAYYRQWYILENITRGGNGGPYPMPEATKLKMSKAQSGKVRTKEQCDNISKAKRGKSINRHSAEAELKRIASLKRVTKLLWQDPEYRKSHTNHSAESIKKQTAWLNDPEKKRRAAEKRSASMKLSWKSRDKTKVSELGKAKWKDNLSLAHAIQSTTCGYSGNTGNVAKHIKRCGCITKEPS